jgi:hypothetical protein
VKQVRRVPSIRYQRLKDHESLIDVRRKSGQVLQSQVPLAIDFRIGKPRL